MDIETIKKRIAQLETLLTEVKAAKEMLKSELESEPRFMEATEEAKSANNKKKQIKDEILGRGPNQTLLQEIKDNMEEVVTLKEILSAELMEVYQEKQIDEIEDHNGATRKFKIAAKLLPRGSRDDSRDHMGRYEEQKEGNE